MEHRKLTEIHHNEAGYLTLGKTYETRTEVIDGESMLHLMDDNGEAYRTMLTDRFVLTPNPYKAGDKIITTSESDWSDLRGTVIETGIGPDDQTDNDGPYCMCEFDAVVEGSKAWLNLKNILDTEQFESFPNTFAIMACDEIRLVQGLNRAAKPGRKREHHEKNSENLLCCM